MTEKTEDNVHTSMRELLNEIGVLTYRISGTSMLPLLRQNKDLVTVRKYDGKGIKKYDIAMYERVFDHRFVLHRVVDVHQGTYTFLGDNCSTKEYHIPEERIVAVLESFERNNRVISVNSMFFKAFGRIHYYLFPIRKIWYRIRGKAAGNPYLKRIYNSIQLHKSEN